MESKSVKPILENALEEIIPSSQVNLWREYRRTLLRDQRFWRNKGKE
jgi:hypothetical protein